MQVSAEVASRRAKLVSILTTLQSRPRGDVVYVLTRRWRLRQCVCVARADPTVCLRFAHRKILRSICAFQAAVRQRSREASWFRRWHWHRWVQLTAPRRFLLALTYLASAVYISFAVFIVLVFGAC